MPTSQMLQCAASGRGGVVRPMPTMVSPARLTPRALVPRALARVTCGSVRSHTTTPIIRVRAQATSPPAWPPPRAPMRAARGIVSCKAASSDPSSVSVAEAEQGAGKGGVEEGGPGEDVEAGGADPEVPEAPEPRSRRARVGATLKALPRLLLSIPLRLLYQVVRRLPKRLVQSPYFGMGLALSIVSSVAALTNLLTGRGRRAAKASPPVEVLYSDFLSTVAARRVRAVRFQEGGDRLYFDLLPDGAPGTSAAARTSEAPTRLAARSAALDAAQRARQRPSKKEGAPKGQGFMHKLLWGARGKEAAAKRPPPVVAALAPPLPRQYCTYRIANDNLVATLSSAGVDFGVVKPPVSQWAFKGLATVMMLWLPLLPFFFIMRKLTGGDKTGKKAGPKGEPPGSKKVITFKDVAGVDSAKVELMECVQCLRDAGRYAKLGAKMPTGVLLSGPPGTGKTLLAKAVAGEAGVPFFSASASEFVEMFVGRGAARVRELFAEARKRAPCVVFIDELDAVGGRRGAGLNEERDQTLNQLLTEMDGFDATSGILVLAATNRPEVLDPALTRPGRLTRRVGVERPDAAGRAEILQVHMRGVPLEAPGAATLAAQVAAVASGFSGAELQNVVNEGALMAARKGKEVVGLEDLLEGVTRTKFGSGMAPSPIAAGQGFLKGLGDSIKSQKGFQMGQPMTPGG
mmetsp:Transcript_49706/g.158751  ORF Transcript_49706/g.158751 Transcript_49706/m.158751 type:complete len:688 (-) Transcript_49706:156-2219(-)